ERQVPGVVQPPAHARRQAAQREAALLTVVRLTAHALAARAKLDAETIPLRLLDDEHAELAGLRGGHEGFLADGGEITIQALHADGAAEGTERLVGQLGAELVGVAEEARADLVALELGVLVVVVADAEAQR